MVLGELFLLVFITGDFNSKLYLGGYKEGYKEGQIDALIGNIRYEKVVQENESIIWEKMEESK